MRWSIGIVAVMVLAAAGSPTPAATQQILETPLPSPPVSRSPQVAQSPHMTTQDCVRMPTPAEQTDCLNQIASEGNYMPTAPAPGTDMPMEFRLPLGTREVTPSR